MSNQHLTFRELLIKAKELGIPNIRSLTKARLLAAIGAKQSNPQPVPSFEHELNYGPITSITPEDQEQKTIVLEAYPMLWRREHVIDTMPAESIRDFESQWAKENTSWAPWRAVADDIDGVVSSPDEKDRDLLSLLLEYVDHPTNALLKSILDFDVGQWTDLYSALSYAILRDKNAVPLILKFAPLFMDDLMSIYEERVAFVFAIDYKASDEEKHSPKLTFEGEKELSDLVWGLDEILKAVSSAKAAEWLVGVADGRGFDLETRYDNNLYIAEALFDNDHITKSIIQTLCNAKDVVRLTTYIDNMAKVDERIARVILESKQPELAVQLVKKLYAINGNSFVKDFLNGEIHDVKLDSKTLAAIIAYLKEAERIAGIEINDEELNNEILPQLIQKNDLELIELYERLGLLLNVEEMLIGEEEIYLTSLNYVLRSANYNLYDKFYSIYSPNSVRLLYDLMEDLSHDSEFPLNQYDEQESPMGVEWLLQREEFTNRELVTAIALSNNPYKTRVVLKKLGLEYDEKEAY